MRRCCPLPAPAPFAYGINCAKKYVRSCADGTGVVIGFVPGAYFFVKPEEDETLASAQERANELAEELAKGRALQKVLTCNTISEEDLADCGLVDVRPDIGGCDYLCTNTGNPICTDTGSYLGVY